MTKRAALLAAFAMGCGSDVHGSAPADGAGGTSSGDAGAPPSASSGHGGVSDASGGAASWSASSASIVGSGGDGNGSSAHGGSGGAFATGGVAAAGGAGGGASGIGGQGVAGGCPAVTVDTALPDALSATGLYADIATYALAAGVATYAPRFELWADGAEKHRYVALPACTQIDTTDPDHWSFPVGTKLWKEFRVGGVRIETRLIERIGAGPGDFLFGAYQWNADHTEAHFVPDGVIDANGTSHDIPAVWECLTCHGETPEHVIGFSAVQLSHGPPGVTLDGLAAAGRLTSPVADYVVPGDSTTAAVLGYLHANCGHCHQADGISFNPPFVLRLSVAAKTLAETGVFQTAVGVPVAEFAAPGIVDRIAPGNPSASCVAYRMSVRGTSDQMPPFATKLVDTADLTMIENWIAGLPP